MSMAMKTMKAQSMKKLNNTVTKTRQIMNNAMKKPAKKEDEKTALTSFALGKLGGCSDKKVEDFLETLDDKEQMRLWKTFERNRELEGENVPYKKVTSGMGKISKSRQLLKIWIQSGGTTRNALYQEAFMDISSSHEKGRTEIWQPLHYMLNHKFGMKELKARVLSGSIAIRANPKDPRFAEFCEETEFVKKSVCRTNTLHVKGKGAEMVWTDFDHLQKMDIEADHDVRFANGPGPSEQETPLALTGWSPIKGLPLEPSTQSNVHESRSTSGQSAASMILATMANSESLASKKSSKEMKLGVVKCRGGIETMLTNLEEHSRVSSKPIQKKIQIGIGELKVAHKLLSKPKVFELKSVPMMKLVNKAATLARKHADLLQDK